MSRLHRLHDALSISVRTCPRNPCFLSDTPPPHIEPQIPSLPTKKRHVEPPQNPSEIGGLAVLELSSGLRTHQGRVGAEPVPVGPRRQHREEPCTRRESPSWLGALKWLGLMFDCAENMASDQDWCLLLAIFRVPIPFFLGAVEGRSCWHLLLPPPLFARLPPVSPPNMFPLAHNGSNPLPKVNMLLLKRGQ